MAVEGTSARRRPIACREADVFRKVSHTANNVVVLAALLLPYRYLAT